MNKFKKQTKPQLKAIADLCRRWPSFQLGEVTKLFHHIQAQNLEIEKLESEIRDYRQRDFFKEATSNKVPWTAPIKEPITRYPLAHRLSLMERDSREWQLTLKFNQITHERAIALVEEWINGPKILAT